MAEQKQIKPSVDLQTAKGREDRRQQLLAQADYFERTAAPLKSSQIGHFLLAYLAEQDAAELRRQAAEIK